MILQFPLEARRDWPEEDYREASSFREALIMRVIQQLFFKDFFFMCSSARD